MMNLEFKETTPFSIIGKFLLIALLSIYFSISGFAVNSGSTVNNPENSVHPVEQETKSNSSRIERKQSKFKKRLQALLLKKESRKLKKVEKKVPAAAIWSFGLGILGIPFALLPLLYMAFEFTTLGIAVLFFAPLSLLSGILGFIALRKIKKSKGKHKGRLLAILGIIFSAFPIAVLAYLFITLKDSVA